MRRPRKLSLLLLIVRRFLPVAEASSNDKGQLVCLVGSEKIEYKRSDNNVDSHLWRETEYTCNPVTGDGYISELTYGLEIPEVGDLKEAYREFSNLGLDLFITIEGGTLSEDSVIVPEGYHVQPTPMPNNVRNRPQRHRRLSRPDSEGDLTAIVLRIIAQDGEPDISAEKLYELTFESDVSLKEQMKRCSFGKLRIEPTRWGGVVDVHVNSTADGNSRRALVNSAYASFDDVRSMADFIMFVLPPGTGDWGAFAATPGQQSVFHNEWGGFIGATAHEIGHNLGLEHAYYDGNEYGGLDGS